jgi:hypothetical protein
MTYKPETPVGTARENPISLGIVGINQGDSYISYAAMWLGLKGQ